MDIKIISVHIDDGGLTQWVTLQVPLLAASHCSMTQTGIWAQTHKKFASERMSHETTNDSNEEEKNNSKISKHA